MLDFIRIACAVPNVAVGNVAKNTEDICKLISDADGRSVDLLCFPELALTGYSCADLFFQQALLTAAQKGLAKVVRHSKLHPAVTAVVGVPLGLEGQLYNCAAVVSDGVVRAVAVKTFLPDYGGYGERRWFSPATYLTRKEFPAFELGLEGEYTVPVGNDLVMPVGEAMVAVEICEDLWAPVTPSSMLTLGGAEVVVNLAAAVETAGRKAVRREMVSRKSDSSACIYAFCSAGPTESTQDQICCGHSVIAQCGAVLAESGNTVNTGYMLVQDCDLGVLRGERAKNTTFRDTAALYGRQNPVRICKAAGGALRGDGTVYKLSKLPFVPEKKAERTAWCNSVFDLQVEGLMRRLSLLNTNAVIGVSGGLDSTLALLVAVEAMHRLGRPAGDVYGVTMPCFGTSDRTYENSWELMRTLGISAKEISIRDAVTTHFRDIGHDMAKHDGTYENSQARERTQILMDYASVVGGIVVGTGDLSELALGWCTYNGDHMSMYGVNASLPKTLIRWVIDTMANTPRFAASKAVLMDILDTPISPELLPPDASGKISQQTEDIVGPYSLHDFFLYHMLNYGFSPEKIYTLACRTFAEDFDSATVKKWLQAFYRRFFTQQFKRNCMPEGAKALSLSLSPRGDWRMPSDASGRLWLQQIEKL